MLGVKVTVPIACFRKGLARSYLETYDAPPPATCYGFLLSLVGETNRERHIGARVTATVVGESPRSVVLRTVWRVKSKKNRPGAGDNKAPDFQQLLTDVRLIVWIDSTGEERIDGDATLEERVAIALDPKRRGEIERFGGLSFGESSHLVDEVSLYDPNVGDRDFDGFESKIFVVDDGEETTLPVWVDHVGSAGTRYATGIWKDGGLGEPTRDSLPEIRPEN